MRGWDAVAAPAGGLAKADVLPARKRILQVLGESAAAEQSVDHPPPIRGVPVGARAIGLEFLVTELPDLLGVRPPHHLHHMVRSEPLSCPPDRGEHDLGVARRVDRFDLPATNVARPAVVLRILLAEVGEELAAAAGVGGGEMHHPLEQLLLVAALGVVLHLPDEVADPHDVSP